MRQPIFIYVAVVTLTFGLGVVVAGVPPPALLTGHVYDYRSGEPINEATVIVYLVGSPRDTVTAVTDSLGSYRLAIPRPARFLFLKSGYVPKTLRWPEDLEKIDEECACSFEFKAVYLNPADTK